MTKLQYCHPTVKSVTSARLALLLALAMALPLPILFSVQKIEAASSTDTVAKPPRPVRVTQARVKQIQPIGMQASLLTPCGGNAMGAATSLVATSGAGMTATITYFRGSAALQLE